MIAYFDTSAFTKLFVPEEDSAKVAIIWRDAERVVSSRLLYPEARAALARAAREQRVGSRKSEVARMQLEDRWRDIERVELTDDLARDAGELAEAHALRGSDAVHLASALSLADEDVVLVAADLRLLAAAQNVGLTTSA